MRSPTLAKKIAGLALTRKASDVVIMDLRKLTAMTDYFVICSADSDVQVKAVADAVQEGLEEKALAPWHTEGGSANWILLDYVDVVLHVFHKNTRAYYNFEKLWGDAEIDRVSDEPARMRKHSVRSTRTKRKSTSRKSVVS